jgi:hypothetical protein
MLQGKKKEIKLTLTLLKKLKSLDLKEHRVIELL